MPAIRYDGGLAGGAMMDLGWSATTVFLGRKGRSQRWRQLTCWGPGYRYALNAVRTLLGRQVPEVISAEAQKWEYDGEIDEGIDWALSVFVDNAGIIAFDDRHAVCFKVETHNHPSALEPYGGAATGIGGCIRDIIGTGLAARWQHDQR